MTERGFRDVAIESSHAFRAIMEAMARPGRVCEIAADIAAPGPLLASTAAVALTLCDFQTPVWLAPGLRTDRIAQYLRFHAGVPITEEAGKAHFALASITDMLDPAELLPGTHEYPDRSATLIIQVSAFRAGDVELTGPGIRVNHGFGIEGLDGRFWTAMAENHARFPIGIDVIFVAPGLVSAVPRSTAIRLLEAA